MTRRQCCRENARKYAPACGLEEHEIRWNERAAEFCNVHVEISPLSTHAVHAIMAEKDPEIQRILIEKIVARLNGQRGRGNKKDVTERDVKKIRRELNKEKRILKVPIPASGSYELRPGDFREVLADLAPDSVDLILTDPPYAEEFLSLYESLGAFAARVLKPGGSLLCYAGQSTVFKAHALLEKNLRYWWLLSLTHLSGGQKLPGKWVIIEWKPILWFVKESRRSNDFLVDQIQGTPPRKELHEWAQGTDEVIPLIETLTSPGDLIVDPFAGSGSFGKAAETLGRKFIGADLNV